MKYRRKSVEIEAFKYDGDLKGSDGEYYVPNWAVEAFENGVMYYGTLKFNNPPELFIDTLSGVRHINVGDYIICDARGELYSCNQAVFEETYEIVK